MPVVRRYEDGQVQPAPLPGSRFSPNAGAESFGGGQAKQLQQFGQGLQAVGEGAGKIAAVFQSKSQDRKDKALVRDALNRAESDMRLFEGDMLRPENRERALDAYSTAQKELTEMRKRYSAELKNERQRELFIASFDTNMNGLLDRSFALQEKSRVDFEKTTRLAQNQSAVENAVAARTDVKAIAEAEKTILYNTAADMIGLPKELKEKAKAEALNNLHGAVLSARTQDDPRAAQEYLKTNWDKFNPVAREKLKEDLDKQAFDWQVREDAGKLVGAALTDEQIEAELSKEKDPKKQDALRAAVKSKLEDRKIAREIQEKENLYSAWQNVMQGGDIPWFRVSGSEAKAMEVYKKAELRGFAQESDKAALIGLGRLTDSELKEIDEVTMAGYAQSLTREDFNAVFSRYRELRRGNETSTESSKLTQIRTDAAMVTDALSVYGIDISTSQYKDRNKKRLKETQDEHQIINEVTRQFEREINQGKAAKGRDLYPEEKRQILDDLLIRGKRKKFLFETDTADLDRVFSVNDIPDNMQRQMEEAFKLRGISPTNENKRLYWLEYLKSRKE